ncbi:2607_t:CDS:2, partial [Dentiscutata heterogama]
STTSQAIVPHHPLTYIDIVFGIIWIIIGLFQCFYGYKFIRITMFFVGFVWFAFIAYLIADYLYGTSPAYSFFVIILISGLVGAIICFFLWELSILLIGGYGGIGSPFYSTYAIIATTSIGGAFAIIWGIDDFLQTGFQTLFLILFKKENSYFEADWKVYVLLACWILLIIAGIAWELYTHQEMVLHPTNIFLWCVCWSKRHKHDDEKSQMSTKDMNNSENLA